MSRNKKYKKSLQNRSKKATNKFQSENKPSRAPKPIKMNYYEWSFDGLRMDFSEQLDIFRIMGKEATDKFPEKYNQLQKWFAEYGQTKILSFSLYYFICRPAGYDEKAETGALEFPSYYLELLQAIALKDQQIHSAKPFSQEVLEFKRHLQEVGELNKHKFYDFPDSVKTQDDLAAYLLRSQIIMDTTAVRNWSYEHLMKTVVTGLTESIRDDFINVYQFCPLILLDLLSKMTEAVEVRINEHKQKVVSFFRENNHEKVFDAYEKAFPVHNTTNAQRKQMWKQFNMDLNQLKAMFLMHSDYFLEKLFTFSLEDIQSLCDDDVSINDVQRMLDLLSYSFGDLKEDDQDRFILGNPVLNRPFIKLEEEGYFSALWMVMTHSSLTMIEYLVSKSQKLREKYNLKRGGYLEQKIVEIFKTNFPMAECYSGSQWKGIEKGYEKDYENDLLVIIDGFALVIEAKAGTVSAPAKRGAPERLAKTLQELVEEPSEQALRFIKFLKENPTQLSLKVKKGPNNRFDASKIKYFIPLGVTLSQLGGMVNNLKMLVKSGITKKSIEELATSISLTDLMIVFDLLPLAADKIHYLQRRREIDSSIEYFGDEMDLLAWYLDNGFNFSNDEKNKAIMLTLKSKELDHYIIGNARGEIVNKLAPKRIKWWDDILIQIEDRKKENWIRNSYILLNFPENEQREFEKEMKMLRQKMSKNSSEYPHNWVIYGSPDDTRQFFVAGYCYYDHVKKDRDAMCGDIFQDEITLSGKGKLILAINVDKGHYPYSAIVSWGSEEVFENNYKEFVKA